VYIEGIGKNADDVHPRVEDGIGDAFRNPEASEQSIPMAGIIDKGIAPSTISRLHVCYLGQLIFGSCLECRECLLAQRKGMFALATD